MADEIPVSVIRGGTSRGVFLRLSDLPRDGDARDALCVGLTGAPDPLAVDGLGGGASSNSKVMAVGVPSDLAGLPWEGACPRDVDLVTVFAQPAITSTTVDWTGNCGNLSAAVGVFALDEGLVEGCGEHATLRVWNANTGANFVVEHASEGGKVPRVDLSFLAPGGETTGAVFPSGAVTTLAGGVEATVVDVTNPLVIVDARRVGVDVGLTRDELNADAGLLERIELLRRDAARRIGMPESAVVPKVACVAPGTDGADVDVRVTSLGVFHHAVPVTVALALGSAAVLTGTVMDAVLPGPPERETTLRHPKGTVTVLAETSGGELLSAGVARTARVVMKGTAYLP
ncbi:PrpF domain-containing protein [Corynebacterium sp.]|uniref:PrpF domain-containing protein n=1 Tax=Corynebacterium sp. TaxID=1720 RepID=UPI0025BA5263|nr:PrpF domain-containing protein [Corynebacterium sp.]